MAADHSLERGDLGFILFEQRRGANIIVERAAFQLLNPSGLGGATDHAVWLMYAESLPREKLGRLAVWTRCCLSWGVAHVFGPASACPRIPTLRRGRARDLLPLHARIGRLEATRLKRRNFHDGPTPLLLWGWGFARRSRSGDRDRRPPHIGRRGLGVSRERRQQTHGGRYAKDSHEGSPC